MLEDFPNRIFLDSSTLQTLQNYGGFLYEWEPLKPEDRIYRDKRGTAKLEAMRFIMKVAERAPFQFALSENSFSEVERADDRSYLQWAYDVHEHWHRCLAESGEPRSNSDANVKLSSASFGYLGDGDRKLLADAVHLGCDTFLTMENRLPKNGSHLLRSLGIRVETPCEVWERILPWASLFI